MYLHRMDPFGRSDFLTRLTRTHQEQTRHACASKFWLARMNLHAMPGTRLDSDLIPLAESSRAHDGWLLFLSHLGNINNVWNFITSFYPPKLPRWSDCHFVPTGDSPVDAGKQPRAHEYRMCLGRDATVYTVHPSLHPRICPVGRTSLPNLESRDSMNENPSGLRRPGLSERSCLRTSPISRCILLLFLS